MDTRKVMCQYMSELVLQCYSLIEKNPAGTIDNLVLEIYIFQLWNRIIEYISITIPYKIKIIESGAKL